MLADVHPFAQMSFLFFIRVEGKLVILVNVIATHLLFIAGNPTIIYIGTVYLRFYCYEIVSLFAAAPGLQKV
jgi:hypothetical protein